MTTYYVKSVQSGDSLVLLVPNVFPQDDVVVSLSGIAAPRMGTNKRQEDSWAWEARECLRKLVIGKTIKYTKDYSTQSREYGRVTIGDVDPAVALLREGLVEAYGQKSASYAAYHELQEEAKAKGAGKWGKSIPVLRSFDEPRAAEFAKQFEGKDVSAIVEFVVNCGQLKLTLLPSHQALTVALSGYASPKADAQFAKNAKFFVERALLNREIHFHVEGTVSFSTDSVVLGSVVNNKKCFQAEVIRNGWVAINAFNFQKNAFKAQLQQAEQEARTKKAGLWATADAALLARAVVLDDAPRANDGAVIKATVVQVNSGDTLTIHQDGTPAEQLMKVTLAGTKCGKVAVKEANREWPEYSWNAREFVRHAVLGKPVDVTVYYTRNINVGGPAEGGEEGGHKTTEARSYVQVTFGKPALDLAYELILRGYATAMSGPQQPANADSLREAEKKAREEGLGLHSASEEHAAKKEAKQITTGSVESGVVVFTDYSKAGLKKAKPFFDELKKEGAKLKGIVETVMNPCRYRVAIPSKKANITVSLSGVAAPSAGRRDASGAYTEQPEPFGVEALQFAQKFLQQDCFLHIDSVGDKVMNNTVTFFGAITIGDKKISVALVENGLADLTNAVMNVPNPMELKNAQKTATTLKKGIFSVSEDNRPRAKHAAARKGYTSSGLSPVVPSTTFSGVITEVESPTVIYVQKDDSRQSLEKIERYLAQTAFASMQPVSGELKRGDIVVGQFSGDGKYYRAKIITARGQDSYTVSYIDYGNSETIKKTKLWNSSVIQQNIAGVPPCAVAVEVAFLREPDKDIFEDEYEQAGQTIQSFGGGRASFTVLYRNNQANGRLGVIPTAAAGTLQAVLIREGTARLQTKFNSPSEDFEKELAPLRELQRSAQTRRAGIFRRGNIGSDDEN